MNGFFSFFVSGMGWPGILLEYSNGEFAFKLIEIIGRIQFFMFVELRCLSPCWF